MPPVHEVKAPNRRLDSWKEIAGFFDRDERTVKRWEKERQLPVHRLPGGSRARVFAFTEELQRWMHSLESSAADAIDTSEDQDAATHLTIVEQLPIASLEAAHVESPAPSHISKRTLAGVACVLLAVLWIGFFLVTHRRHAAALTRSNATPPRNARNVHAVEPQAQELYLRGRYYWDKRTPEDLNRAVDFFTQAIVHDPNYAQAYVGLADCYLLLREFATMPAAEAYPRALAAAKKAVELDDSSAEAHASLAFNMFYWGWDQAGAEREFRRSIELDPNYGLAHQWFANALATTGRVSEALQEINRAEQINPASNAILADKALILLNLGRTNEAAALLKQLEDSQPGFFSTHKYLSYIYYSRGDYRNYVAEAMTAATLSHDEDQLAIARAAEQGFQSGGKHGMLLNTLKVQEKLLKQGRMSPFLVASTCARLGQNEDAMHYLEIAEQQHDPALVAVRGDTDFNPLHNDPRFRAMLIHAGIAPLS